MSQATAVVCCLLSLLQAEVMQKIEFECFAVLCCLVVTQTKKCCHCFLSRTLSAQANAALDHADGSSISGVTDRVSEACTLLCCLLSWFLWKNF